MDLRPAASRRKRKSTEVISEPNTEARISAYDTSLPQNWSVQKLKNSLRQMGVNPGLRVKKAGLIRLYQSAKSGDESNTVTSSAAVITTNDVYAQPPVQRCLRI